MRWIGFAAIVIAMLTHPAAAAERRATGGVVRGADMPDGSMLFRGIPYAAPPVGALRWKPPMPAKAWRGVRDASKPAATCVQSNEGWNAADFAAGKEDCLTLSIRAPKQVPGKGLPVLFWIHGGANLAGSGNGQMDSVIHRQGIVHVAIQYRLGVLGFLGLPELRAESPRGSSGNYALLDQIAALRWVKANVARFGGDPDNITIAGNSAGAFDAVLLTLSPLARGLFDKAIIQAAAPGPPRTAPENERIGSALYGLMGIPHGAAGLAALRAASPEALIAASAKLVTPRGVHQSFLWEQEVIDGWVIPAAYGETYRRGHQARVPVIIGSNSRELGADRPPETAPALVREAYGGNADEALALYGFKGGTVPADDPVLGAPTTQVVTDMWFRCPANWLARRMSAGGKVWRYEFGLGWPGSGKPPEHTSEMPYVFGPPPADATPPSWPPLQLYWANFMRTGDPNGPGLAAWPELGDRADYVEFTPTGPKRGTDLRGPLCRLMNGDRSYP